MSASQSKKGYQALKNLSAAEAAQRIQESEAALFEVKMKKVTGQLQNTAQIWKLRKELARLKTLQTQFQAQSAKGDQK